MESHNPPLRPYLMLEPDALHEFSGIDTSNPNAVLVGLAPSRFTYSNLTQAMQILLAGGPLIAIHKGRTFQTSEGLALGPGAFVAALEYASDVKSSIIGKPSPEFFNVVQQSIGLKPDEVVMIGDDVRDDVGAAQALGILGILVKTGKYRVGDETGKKDGVLPDYVVDNFAQAVDLLIASAN